MAAGAGAAAADLTYAALAAAGGRVLAPMLTPYAAVIRLLAGAILLALAAIRIWRALHTPTSHGDGATPRSIAAVFLQFLGLTLVNPLTIIYFAALILGGVELEGRTGAVAFVAGAGLASLSWQWLLAGLGALGRRGLPPRGRAAAIWIGNLIVAGLGPATASRPRLIPTPRSTFSVAVCAAPLWSVEGRRTSTPPPRGQTLRQDCQGSPEEGSEPENSPSRGESSRRR